MTGVLATHHRLHCRKVTGKPYQKHRNYVLSLLERVSFKNPKSYVTLHLNISA